MNNNIEPLPFIFHRSKHLLTMPKNVGFFALLDDDNCFINWYHCREDFQKCSRKIERFLFCHYEEHLPNIAGFIQYVEGMLDVSPRTLFQVTNMEDVYLIYPSDWWMKYSMRRSLFTMFLRAGAKFNIERPNLSEVISEDAYLSDTEFAVRRFLDGHTRYTGKMTGWHYQFWVGGMRMVTPSKKKIRELLTKPV